MTKDIFLIAPPLVAKGTAQGVMMSCRPAALPQQAGFLFAVFESPKVKALYEARTHWSLCWQLTFLKAQGGAWKFQSIENCKVLDRSMVVKLSTNELTSNEFLVLGDFLRGMLGGIKQGTVFSDKDVSCIRTKTAIKTTVLSQKGLVSIKQYLVHFTLWNTVFGILFPDLILPQKPHSF